MDHIDQHLATTARNNTYAPCIQAAVAMGKKLLNKYYSYTDHSELYRIAMGEWTPRILSTFHSLFVVLHPSHKLAYFAQARWDNDWHATAEQIVRAEFERAYADLEAVDSQDTQDVSNSCLILSYADMSLDGQHCDIRQHLRRVTCSFGTYEGRVG
jgi:hypothetical protein